MPASGYEVDILSGLKALGFLLRVDIASVASWAEYITAARTLAV